MAGDIDKAYQLVIQACDDPFIGYSQGARRTISLGVAFRTYCDCSSLISWACANSGFVDNNPWFTTANMIEYLLSWGWREVDINGEWKPGDVVWKTGHTEMVHQGRITMGAHTDTYPFPEQVSINAKPTSPGYYSRIFRYGEGASGEGAKGISAYVAAAIFGNWSRESTMNPGVYEGLSPSGNGFGLGQWSFERRTALEEWLDSHGYDRDDGDGQIEFFVYEDDWQSSTSTPLQFANLTEFLTSDSTDIAALTETFMNAWERPGVPALEERIAFANKAYQYIQEHSGEKVEWYHGNFYLGESQQLNNALAGWNKLGLLFPGTPGGEGWSNTLRYGAARELYRRRYIWR